MHLAPALAARGHQVLALGLRQNVAMPGVQYLNYSLARGNHPEQHPWLISFESQVLRGQACAQRLAELRQHNWYPDCVVAHAGWGEALFVKDIFPQTKLLCFLEFAYHSRGFDVGFDPEFSQDDWQKLAPVGLKNATNLLMLAQMDAAYTPTHWQKSTQPEVYQPQIKVIHDGIDTGLLQPHPGRTVQVNTSDGPVTLRAGDKVISFVNRNLEPYRGYHQFMRALPAIQQAHPDAMIFIVGGDKHSYGSAAPEGQSWKQLFLDEVKAQLDLSKVFFTGQLSYQAYQHLLQVSACHVYLSYPFVLSWSLLEAMSMQCAIVASATAPVMEVIQDGENGMLVDFFNPQDLAVKVNHILSSPECYTSMREQARRFVQNHYDLNTVCLPQQIALVEQLGSR